MPITTLNKELVAVAISVAAGCQPCTAHHLGEARRAGASDVAIEKAVASAVCVRTSATEGMRRHALGLAPEQEGCGCASTQPVEELSSSCEAVGQPELIALGASLAVNCTESIAKHLTAAKAAGVPQEHLDELFALVGTIRSRAVVHAEAQFRGSAPAAARCC